MNLNLILILVECVFCFPFPFGAGMLRGAECIGGDSKEEREINGRGFFSFLVFINFLDFFIIKKIKIAKVNGTLNGKWMERLN